MNIPKMPALGEKKKNLFSLAHKWISSVLDSICLYIHYKLMAEIQT